MSKNPTAAARLAPAATTWAVDAAASAARFSVRNFGVRRVHGTMAVTRGSVRVDEQGRPRWAEGVVDVSTIRTGNGRRDADLCHRRFLDVAEFPEIRLVTRSIDEAAGGWTVAASIMIRGVAAPLSLHVRPLENTADGRRRVEARGVLDLRTTPIRVPRAVVGRYVEIHVEAVLMPTDAQI